MKNIILKILIPIISVIIIISIFLFYFVVISPQNKYNEAISLLEQGKYNDAKLLLDKITNYKDVDIIQEQIKYESIAYNCINELKKNLKNPDSYTPYEIQFYLPEDDSYPACVMYYGAQNGFGGNTTGYATFTYSEESKQYNLIGHTNTLKKDDLKEKDDDYLINLITIITIEAYREVGVEVGIIDMARLKTVLKNDTYTTIKIIN